MSDSAFGHSPGQTSTGEEAVPDDESLDDTLSADAAGAASLPVSLLTVPAGQRADRLDKVLAALLPEHSRSRLQGWIEDGHVQVNGRKVNIPSFQCKIGDEIAVRQGSKELVQLATAKDFASGQNRVNWIDAQPDNLSGKIVALPKREDIHMPINEQLIVELYSK